MPGSLHRREFLRSTGMSLAFGALGIPAEIPQGRRRVGPNDRIGLGIIGVGGLGGGYHHLGRVLGMADFQVLALADVDRDHLARAVQKTHGRARGHADYRALLDRQDIDAVIIATPDHWHALCAIHACEAGKDVYGEKPLSLTIAEGRRMVAAARRYGRVFQTGSQQRSDSRFHWACDLVRNGRIGTLKSVKVVLGRGPTLAREAAQEIPKTLDWNSWLGAAPRVPYHQKRCHYTFRWFFDYSGGKMTDWGAHHLDIAQWGLGTELSGPRTVEGHGTFPRDNFYETPVDFDVHYTYASGVSVHATGKGENGVTFQGSQGEIFVSRGKISANPKEILDQKVDQGRVKLYRSRSHHGNWVACMRSRERPICDVEIGHRSASVCHLGNLALRLGRKLTWDPDQERFVGDPAANRLLDKPLRSPWSYES